MPPLKFSLILCSVLLIAYPAFGAPVLNVTTFSARATNETIPESRQGWTSGPNQRGTIGILWSCCVTLFLCSWSSLCLNASKETDKIWHIWLRKFMLTGLCMLGPEFIFQAAMGQWCSARRSVKMFKQLGIESWTMKQAFFVDMGGLMVDVEIPHPGGRITFPINARQLHYLIEKHYITWPSVAPKVDARLIDDQNKVDGFVRVLTLLQTLWFLINVCGRAASGLDITTLEITTVAFISCTIGTVFCWYKKPADIRYPTTIRLSAPIKQILEEGGAAAEGRWYYTPLDFISRSEWPWTVFWSHWTNILRAIGINFTEKGAPIRRIQTTTVLRIDGRAYLTLLAITISYLVIFFLAWNFSFPSDTERMLWRTASTAALACLAAYALSHLLMSLGGDTLKDHCQLLTTSSAAKTVRPNWFRRAGRRVFQYLRNNSVSQDPQLDAPPWAILVTYIAGLVYCFARLYIWVADAIELRSLPTGAYQEVQWTSIFPHF